MKYNSFKNLSNQQRAILRVITNRPKDWPYCNTRYIKIKLDIGKSKSEANSFSRSIKSLRDRGIIERLGTTRLYRIVGEKERPRVEGKISGISIM